MKEYKASISKIESFSTVDGPGIRTTIFFNKCCLRCKYCHNPETWNNNTNNYTITDIYNKIIRNKPYYKNNGGITLSGGEPLLHYDFILQLCKKLKKENIHIALDTAGIGYGNYKELLQYIDLIILDVKHINENGFKEITQKKYWNRYINFINQLKDSKKNVLIRQVIIPGINDNTEYIRKLSAFLKNNFQNITKIEFLPFHTMGFKKYKDLEINNPYKQIKALDTKKCDNLYKQFIKVYKKEQQ